MFIAVAYVDSVLENFKNWCEVGDVTLVTTRVGPIRFRIGTRLPRDPESTTSVCHRRDPPNRCLEAPFSRVRAIKLGYCCVGCCGTCRSPFRRSARPSEITLLTLHCLDVGTHVEVNENSLSSPLWRATRFQNPQLPILNGGTREFMRRIYYELNESRISHKSISA